VVRARTGGTKAKPQKNQQKAQAAKIFEPARKKHF
jgi:hypothetical protein